MTTIAAGKSPGRLRRTAASAEGPPADAPIAIRGCWRSDPEEPLPEAGTWGDHPCGMRAPMEEAVIEQRNGTGMEAVIRQLELDEPRSLGAALASLGRGMLAKKA